MSTSLCTLGGRRCTPRMAMSEQCTAPHMFRQQATAMRSLAGRSSCVKRSMSASIIALDQAGSVGGRGVAVHPALRVHNVADGIVGAAHGNAQCGQFLLQRLDQRRVGEEKFDIVAAGKAQITAAIFVGEVGVLAQGLNAEQARRAGAHGVEPVARFCNMAQDAGRQPLVILPRAVVL